MPFVRHCPLGTKRCRECLRKSKRESEARAWSANPEKKRAQKRAHYARADQAYRDRVKAQAKAWKKAHPLAKQIDRLNYARRKAAAPGRFTPADLEAQFNAQGGACFYCATPLRTFHIEHKTPLSRGGTNWPDNIVCACAACNLRKHNRTAEEFFLLLRGDAPANEVAA